MTVVLFNSAAHMLKPETDEQIRYFLFWGRCFRGLFKPLSYLFLRKLWPSDCQVKNDSANCSFFWEITVAAKSKVSKLSRLKAYLSQVHLTISKLRCLNPTNSLKWTNKTTWHIIHPFFRKSNQLNKKGNRSLFCWLKLMWGNKLLLGP